MPDIGSSTPDIICYERNHLVDVIARVDFFPELAKDLSDLPKAVRDEAMRSFRVVEGNPVTGLTARSTSEGLDLSSVQFRVEKFFGSEREKRIEIAPGSILSSYHRFSTYAQLRQEFFGVLRVLAIERPEILVRRIGFRFINIFPYPTPSEDVTDWSTLISPSLVAANSFSVEGASVAYHGHRIEFVLPDHRLVINYGMHNADYPAAICRKEFVLDLDASCENPEFVPTLPAAGDFLDKLHATIQKTFERAITDKMREYLMRR